MYRLRRATSFELYKKACVYYMYMDISMITNTTNYLKHTNTTTFSNAINQCNFLTNSTGYKLLKLH